MRGAVRCVTKSNESTGHSIATRVALRKHEASTLQISTMLNFKLLPLLAALGLAKIKGEFNSCKRAKAAWIGVDQVADAENGVCRHRCCDAAGRTLGD